MKVTLTLVLLVYRTGLGQNVSFVARSYLSPGNKTPGVLVTFFERKKQLALSKRSTNIRKAFERAGSDLHRATEASFEFSLLIAKAKKLHNIGEQLIKPTCLKIVERLCGPQV